MVLENIDKNNNNQIETEELHNAIINGFFDKKENIDAIKQSLNNNISKIADSLQTTLEKKYNEISKKPFRDQNEEKILWLYNTLIKDKKQQHSNPLSNYNNFIDIEDKSNPENNRPNLSNIEHNHNIAFKQIIDRARNKYSNEHFTIAQNAKEKYSQRKPTEIQDYVKYESVIWAIWKYYEELEQENKQLLKKHGFYNNMKYEDELGRKDTAETFWWREIFACENLFQFLESIQYPWYEQDEKIIQNYNKKTEQILRNRWYLGNNKFSEHSKTYQRFEKEINENLSKTNYSTSIQYLAKHPEPKDESTDSIDEYMHHVENTMLYSQEYEDISKKYGPKLLEGYINTVQDISTLQEQYPWFTQAMTRMADYNQKIEKKKNELNIDNDTITRYIKYNTEASQSVYPLQQRCWSLIQKVQEEIQWNTDNSFIFPAIKKHLQKEKEKQAKTDAVRAIIKTRNPALYSKLSFATWAWNGLVDATVWVGTGLWVLITSIYRNGNQTEANIDKAKAWTNFFKIGQSAAQLEPPVKDGKRNLNFDNGTAQLGSQVSNMLVLLSGAGMVGRWVTMWWSKIGLNLTEKAGRRTWLFTWASMQWLPNTFQEYLGEGIDKSTARKYALWTTLLTSSLETIAPNDMFFGNPSVKNILKQLWKRERAKVVAKLFVKNISKEVGEEIGQETLQLAVERIINRNINEAHDTNLETSLTRADFWTTALLTALTTWIVSSKWALQVSQNTTSHTKTIAWIVQDTKRYQDYTTTLNNIIEGKVNIGIPVEVAQNILGQIENAVKQGNTGIENNQKTENTIEQEVEVEHNTKETYTENKWIDSEKQKEIQEAIKTGNEKKFTEIMQTIWKNRNSLWWKNILSTVAWSSSAYKSEMKSGIEMIRDSIYTDPIKVLEWVKKISANWLKMGIIMMQFLPISPVPGSGKVLLIWLLINEFKRKGPLYSAIMELYDAVSDPIVPPIQKSNKERVRTDTDTNGKIKPTEAKNLNDGKIDTEQNYNNTKEFTPKDNQTLQIPIKSWKVEYTKQGQDGQIQSLETSDITVEQAKECFTHGIDVTAELMENQNRALLSSGALFFNIANYGKLGWDIDVATDVDSFMNIAINTDSDGITKLERFAQEGKIQDIQFTTIVGGNKPIDMSKTSNEQITEYINKGNIRVEFNIKSSDWLLINSEFFPEPVGYGLIQLWTQRTDWKINSYEYEWKQLNVVNDELAAKSYIINLAHEINHNTIAGINKWKKLKDSVRINNIFHYMESLSIHTPKDMIYFIEQTYDDYQSQIGADQGMSEYLKEWLDGLNKIKDTLIDIENDYIITQINNKERWSETTISFEDFVKETYEIKKELTEIGLSNKKIPQSIYDKIIDLKSRIDIHDDRSFAYHYEMYQLQENFTSIIEKNL